MDNIQVAIRVRPLNSRELNSGQGQTWLIENNSITQCSSSGRPMPSSSYTFDRIFGANSKSRDIYEQVASNIVTSAMAGINGTIFAYGQTSSGKTFTMKGSPSERGLITLAVEEVFDYIQQSPDREFLLRVSYLEIYNEVITDLFKPESTNLKIRENVNGDIFVSDLSEEVVVSPDQILKLMDFGENNRHIGETNMNERSSRSHTIFRMVIESRERATASSPGVTGRQSMGGAVLVSSLNLVDLAGSERVSHTGAEGTRLKEGGFINKSLLTLGTVIGKLSDGVNETGHIPYRDSKLTRILQPSLGGNARTAIICTITPATVHSEETIGTLKFATRAKTIRNKPIVNEVVSDEALLKRYKNEISDLKRMLSDMQQAVSATELIELQTEHQKMQEELRRKEREQMEQKEKIEKLTKLILVSTVAPDMSVSSTLHSDDGDTTARLDAVLASSLSRAKSKSKFRRETWWAGAKRSDVEPTPARPGSSSSRPLVPQTPCSGSGSGSAWDGNVSTLPSASATATATETSFPGSSDDRRVSVSSRMSSVGLRQPAQRVSIAPSHSSAAGAKPALKAMKSKEIQTDFAFAAVDTTSAADMRAAQLEQDLRESREQVKCLEEMLEKSNSQLLLRIESAPAPCDASGTAELSAAIAALEREKEDMARRHAEELQFARENEEFVRNESLALVEVVASLEKSIEQLSSDKAHLLQRLHDAEAAAGSEQAPQSVASETGLSEQQRQAYEARISELELELGDVQETLLQENIQLEQELQEARMELEHFEAESTEKDARVEALLADLETQLAKKEQYEGQVEELQTALEQVQQELASVRSSSRSDVDALVTLEARLARALERNDELLAQLTEANATLATQQEAVKAAARNHTATVESLEKRVQELRDEQHAHAPQLLALQMTLEETNRTLENARSQLAVMEERLSQTESTSSEQLNARAESLRQAVEQLDVCRREKEALSEEVKRALEEKTREQRGLLELQTTAACLQEVQAQKDAEISALRGDLAALQLTVECLREERDRESSEQAQSATRCSLLEGLVLAANESLAESRETIGQLESRISLEESTRKAMEEQLKFVQKDAQKDAQRLLEADKELAHTRQQLAGTEQELAATKALLETAASGMSEKTAQLMAKMKQSSDALVALLASKEELLAKEIEKRCAAESLVQSLETKVADLEDTVARVSAALASKTSHISALRAELSEASTKLAALQLEQESKVDELQLQVDELVVKCEALSEARTKLQKEKFECERELRERTETLAGVQQRAAELEERERCAARTENGLLESLEAQLRALRDELKRAMDAKLDALRERDAETEERLRLESETLAKSARLEQLAARMEALEQALASKEQESVALLGKLHAGQELLASLEKTSAEQKTALARLAESLREAEEGRREKEQTLAALERKLGDAGLAAQSLTQERDFLAAEAEALAAEREESAAQLERLDSELARERTHVALLTEKLSSLELTQRIKAPATSAATQTAPEDVLEVPAAIAAPTNTMEREPPAVAAAIVPVLGPVSSLSQRLASVSSLGSRRPMPLGLRGAVTTTLRASGLLSSGASRVHGEASAPVEPMAPTSIAASLAPPMDEPSTAARGDEAKVDEPAFAPANAAESLLIEKPPPAQTVSIKPAMKFSSSAGSSSSILTPQVSSAPSAVGGSRQVKFAEVATIADEDDQISMALVFNKENDLTEQIGAAVEHKISGLERSMESGFASLSATAQPLSSSSSSSSSKAADPFGSGTLSSTLSSAPLRASKRIRPLVASSSRRPIPGSDELSFAAPSTAAGGRPELRESQSNKNLGEQPGECGQQ